MNMEKRNASFSWCVLILLKVAWMYINNGDEDELCYIFYIKSMEEKAKNTDALFLFWEFLLISV